MAVAFSCKTRVCPSCINRRAEVLSHSLGEKLPEGDYRHLEVTLPEKLGLRKRFQLDTRLHRRIGRLVHRVITRWRGQTNWKFNEPPSLPEDTQRLSRQDIYGGLKLHCALTLVGVLY